MRHGCRWRRALSINVRIPFTLLFAVCILVVGSTDSAHASIAVRVHLSQQTMNVAIDGAEFASWPISTARRGYRTPIGIYKPYQLERMHYSRLYDYTPMPYSLFFHGGYAIHGTTEIRNLGRAVSHGCIRLSPDNARALFELVQTHGLQNTTIEITE
jgi:lipoprotein-anchoring transpeptidase ErfK/SrfK